MVAVALLISLACDFPLSKDFVNSLQTVVYWKLVSYSIVKSGTLNKSVVPNSEMHLFLLFHSVQSGFILILQTGLLQETDTKNNNRNRTF